MQVGLPLVALSEEDHAVGDCVRPALSCTSAGQTGTSDCPHAKGEEKKREGSIVSLVGVFAEALARISENDKRTQVRLIFLSSQ